ncbi:MAG: diguanylate cyclase [Acidimicrobiia bacterium]
MEPDRPAAAVLDATLTSDSRALLERLPVGVFDADANGRLRYISARWTSLTGQAVADALGQGWFTLLGEAAHELFPPNGCTTRPERRRVVIEVVGPDGGVRTLAVETEPAVVEGRIESVAGTFTDLTDDNAARARRESEERFRALATFAPIAVFLTDRDGLCSYSNDRWSEMTGRPLGAALGYGWTRAIHPDDAESVLQLWRAKARGCDGFDSEFRVRRVDGSVRWVRARGAPLLRNGEAVGYVGTVEDVTELREAHEELQRLALHDPLTGLANRVLLTDRLTHAIAAARREHHSVGVFVFDLDGFKAVNDTLGHNAGDRLLEHVAAQLRAHSRPGDTVARMGGDEFTVVAPHLHDSEEAEAIATRLLTALQEPLLLDGRRIAANASVGISVGGRHGEDPEDLLREADTAMYVAKARGKAQVVTHGTWSQTGTGGALS